MEAADTPRRPWCGMAGWRRPPRCKNAHVTRCEGRLKAFCLVCNPSSPPEQDWTSLACTLASEAFVPEDEAALIQVRTASETRSCGAADEGNRAERGRQPAQSTGKWGCACAAAGRVLAQHQKVQRRPTKRIVHRCCRDAVRPCLLRCLCVTLGEQPLCVCMCSCWP